MEQRLDIEFFRRAFLVCLLVFWNASAVRAADPDVTRWPYTQRKTPFSPKVADPWP